MLWIFCEHSILHCNIVKMHDQHARKSISLLVKLGRCNYITAEGSSSSHNCNSQYHVILSSIPLLNWISKFRKFGTKKNYELRFTRRCSMIVLVTGPAVTAMRTTCPWKCFHGNCQCTKQVYFLSLNSFITSMRNLEMYTENKKKELVVTTIMIPENALITPH